LVTYKLQYLDICLHSAEFAGIEKLTYKVNANLWLLVSTT